MSLLATDTYALPPELAAAAGDELALDDAIGSLYRYSLVTRDRNGLRVHRLVQVVVRTDAAEEEPIWAAIALELVAASFPTDAQRVTTWPAAERLLAHSIVVTGHSERLNVSPSQTSDLLNRVAMYLLARAQLPAARASFERALRVDQAAHGRDHPDVARDLHGLGWALKELGDLEDARAKFEEAVRVDQATQGRDHPDVARDLHGLGWALKDLGDLEGAKIRFQEALRVDQGAHGRKEPHRHDVARDLHGLGWVLKDLGDLEGAKAKFEEALHMNEVIYGPDHHWVVDTLIAIGILLHDLGDLADARVSLERALSIDEAAYGDNYPAIAMHVSRVADALRRPGDPIGSRAQYERALLIHRNCYGPDHRVTRQTAQALHEF
jgi:tetratricopeptide (TPR) repeat protein